MSSDAVRAALYANSALISAAAALVLPNVPAYVYSMGGDALLASVVLSSFSVTMTLTTLKSPSMVEGRLAGVPVCLGCLGYGWSLLPFLVHPGVFTLAAARAVQGVCSGFSFPANLAAALQLGRRTVALNNMVSNAGFVGGYALSSYVKDPFGDCFLLSVASAAVAVPLLGLRLRPMEVVSEEKGYVVIPWAALCLTLASTLPNSAITLMAPMVSPHGYGPLIAAMTAAGGVAQLAGPVVGEVPSVVLSAILCGVALASGMGWAGVLAAGASTGLMYYAANVFSGGGRGVRSVSLAIGVGYAVNQVLVGAVVSAGFNGWTFADAAALALVLLTLAGVELRGRRGGTT